VQNDGIAAVGDPEISPLETRRSRLP